MTMIVGNEHYLDISRGRVLNTSTIHGFGSHTTVTTSLTTVWAPGGIYVYPASALVMSVVSTNVNDTVAGTGLRSLLIEGLDINRARITEVVVLNGTTPVNTVQGFFRINQVLGTSAGSTGANVGDITITNTAVTYAFIAATEGRSQMGLWSLQATQAAYATGINFSTATGKSMEVQTWLRPPSGVWYKVGSTYINAAAFQVVLDPPTKVPRGSDIEFRAIATAASTPCSVGFDLIFVTE